MFDPKAAIAATSAGEEACVEGRPISDCPYDSASELSFFWLTGWTHENLVKVVENAIIAMVVTIEGLEQVQHLLQAYAEDKIPVPEIIDKLETLKSGLKNYVG